MSLAHEVGSSVTVWKGENEEGGVRAFSESLYIEISFFLIVQMLFIGALPGIVLAQKVKVGYDKSTDFSKYKTYTIAEPAMPPTHPMAYATVIRSIMSELSARGLKQVEKDGDLAIVPAGGVEYGNNVGAATPIIGTYSGPPPAANATMWTGAQGPPSLLGPMVPQGTLLLEFVDRAANKVVWTGSVTEKLDIEQKNKSLDLIYRAVVKLLKRFPPKR